MISIKNKLNSKRAAFELSVSTMIIIVLAVSMLIVGLVFIRNVYKFSVDTVDNLNRKTLDEINKLFTDETQKLVIYLGEQKLAQIEAGTSNAGILIAARTESGTKIENYDDLQFKLELDEGTNNNCVKLLGKTLVTSFFKTPVGKWNNIQGYQADVGKAVIEIAIPEGTRVCTQVVRIETLDKTVNELGSKVVGDSFTVEIIRKGLF